MARIWLDSWRSTGLAEFADPPESELYDDLDQPGWLARLASSGSDIVGFAAFDVKQAQLCQLFVDPPHQGAGVGTLLLDEVKRHLAGGFWLRTAAGNLRARAFYRRHGLRLDAECSHPASGKLVAIYVWP